MMVFNPQHLMLETYWQDLIEEVQTIYPNHHFAAQFESSKQPYRWDENLMRHLLLNLMSNAAKYSPAGGTIECQLAYQNQKAILIIEDHGIGIPQDDQAQLFAPFTRPTNTGQIRGNGLGLTIVKHAVDAHQGTIELTSAPDEGTRIEIELPLRV